MRLEMLFFKTVIFNTLFEHYTAVDKENL